MVAQAADLGSAPEEVAEGNLLLRVAPRPLGVTETSDLRPRVLLAEDDPGVRDAYAELSRLGFAVVGTAGDGRSAVAEAAGPDVVLMDVRMPRMDGIEATRRIRELPFAPEVLVLSGHDEPELRWQAEEAGAAAYLTKDCDPGALADAIWGALFAHPSVPTDLEDG